MLRSPRCRTFAADLSGAYVLLCAEVVCHTYVLSLCSPAAAQADRAGIWCDLLTAQCLWRVVRGCRQDGAARGAAWRVA